MKNKRKHRTFSKNASVSSVRLSKFSMCCVMIVMIALGSLCFIKNKSASVKNNFNNRYSPKGIVNDTRVQPHPNASVDPWSVPSPFAKRPLDSIMGARKNFQSHIAQPGNVAVMNLMCAKGLPGAENLDINKCLNILEGWSRHIDLETERYLSSFFQNPQRFYNSLAYYKVLIMMTVLKDDMKIKYNPDLIRPNQTFDEFQKKLYQRFP